MVSLPSRGSYVKTSQVPFWRRRQNSFRCCLFSERFASIWMPRYVETVGLWPGLLAVATIYILETTWGILFPVPVHQNCQDEKEIWIIFYRVSFSSWYSLTTYRYIYCHAVGWTMTVRPRLQKQLEQLSRNNSFKMPKRPTSEDQPRPRSHKKQRYRSERLVQEWQMSKARNSINRIWRSLHMKTIEVLHFLK